MCGICGICVEDPRAVVDRDLLEAMNAALAHRGPDGQGTLVSGPVALGHRRLSIIDIAGGDQCVHHLNGMFAFALWDSRRGRLLAARDRLGERPFYYCALDGRPARLLRVEGDLHEPLRWELCAPSPAAGYAGALAMEGHG